MNARFSMAKTARDIGVSMERLSTGSRVNSAVDGASDLAIANRLHTRVMGLAMAVKNAADGSSLLNTADGALQEVQALLQRMRELSLSSSNGALDPADRVALDEEYQAALAEIGRIGSATEWNGKTLFDGQGFPGTTKFQVGADAGDTLSVAIDKLATSELGTVAGGSFVSHASTPPSAVTTQDSFTSHAETAPSVQTVNGIKASPGSDIDSDGDVDLLLGSSGNWTYVFENDGTGTFTQGADLPMQERLNSGGDMALADIDSDGDPDLIYGHASEPIYYWLNDGSGNFSQKTQLIDTPSHADVMITGGDIDSDGDVDLLLGSSGNWTYVFENDGTGTFTQGADLPMQERLNSGGDMALADIDSDGDPDLIYGHASEPIYYWLNDGSGNFSQKTQLIDTPSHADVMIATNSLITSSPAEASIDFSSVNLSVGDRITISVTGGTNVSAVLDSSGLGALLTSLSNDLAAQSSLFSAATNSNGVLSVLGLTDGSAIASMSVSLEAGVDTTRLDFNNKNLVEGDQIVIQVSGGTDVQGTIDSNGLDSLLGTLATQLQSQSALFSNAFVNNGVLGVTGPADGGAIASVSVLLNTSSTSLDSTSVATVGSASAAITSLDQAIDDVTGMQVKYGAAVNALNHTTDNLLNVKIQTQSSLSQVMDTDYALETSRFAAAQIIRQASTAILAQANTSKETILTLLKDL